MKQEWKHFLLICSVLCISCTGQDDFQDLKGSYLGQKPPGSKPEVFAPSIVSKENFAEYGGHFSPEGKEFYFTRYSPGNRAKIWVTELEGGAWTEPCVVFFMEIFPGGESCLSPDGKQFIFVHFDPESEDFQHDLYVADRTRTGWGVPHRLTKTELGTRRISPSVAKNGNLYFSGDFDKPDQKDIYCSRLIDGIYAAPQNLGPAVNSEYHEEHVYVSPDERYVLFDSYRPSEYGKSDIYVSHRKKDGTWSAAQNLGPTVNSEHFDWYPVVTPDGKYLLFSRTLPSGNIDIYWVNTKSIKELKPGKFK